jgi:anti-sigma-K factor RskA
MNELSCSAVDELLAGYAADALEEAEQCSAAGHLAECRNHDTELQALRAGLAGLAALIEPVEPQVALRGRLLEAFDNETADQPAVQPSGTAFRLPRLLSPAGFGYALAAGLLLIAVGLGVWGAPRGGDGTQVLVRNTEAAAGSIQVVYIPAQSRGLIDYELSAPPAGRIYQAWHVDAAGNAVSLGLLQGQSGSLAFEVDSTGGDAVALSIEPVGGSRAPTTDPLLVTPLS